MKRILATVLLVAGLTFVGAPAQADPDVPPDCQPTVDYYLAVIGNYQTALTDQEVQTVYWKAAEERVVASAEARNIEYARVVDKNRQLRDKIRYLHSVIRDLRD